MYKIEKGAKTYYKRSKMERKTKAKGLKKLQRYVTLKKVKLL